MKLTSRQIESIRNLKPNIVRSYLELNGWEHYHTYPSNDGSVWIKGNANVRLLHNPNQYVDYTEIMARLVCTINEVDDLSVDEILAAIDEIV